MFFVCLFVCFLRIILKSLCIPTVIIVTVFGQWSMSILPHSGSKREDIIPGIPANFIQSGRRTPKTGGPSCLWMVNSRILLFAATAADYSSLFMWWRREEGGRTIMSTGLYHKCSAFYLNALCWSDIFTRPASCHMWRESQKMQI